MLYPFVGQGVAPWSRARQARFLPEDIFNSVFFKFHFKFCCICACMHMYHARTWRSEGNLGELVHGFSHRGSGD